MLSKSTTYAIRAVLFLSLHSRETKRYSPTEISNVINAPTSFLAKTLQILSKNKLVSSVRGRNGGFYLSEENKENSLILIVECIDGLRKFQECILGLSVCEDKNPCPIHHQIFPLKEKLIEQLTFRTINDLAEDIRKGETHIFL